jgi:uncharacterized lipoprotein YddW (UPF0748 family)
LSGASGFADIAGMPSNLFGASWIGASLLLAARAGGEMPPEPPREFRGAWVATVHNIDWPSRPGLPAAQSQAELRAILNRAAELKLNAILFQVRPSSDALYASKLEPWSPFLTGRMGRAAEYDPLEFAVREAHARGLELHAWFNPFRALTSANAASSEGHVTRTHPEWVRRYAGQAWLDPGEPGAREHARAVILDVVRRYDLDGAHIDDYFYPYPVKDKAGANIPFPDDPSWQRYTANGGKLSRPDWRRENINGFVEGLHRAIKAEKRWVKFGISPFGIWRPRVPESIEARLDAFEELAADSRRWLAEGWCDYFSPQLYWSIDPPAQSFPVLLGWWRGQNRGGRHVWPGIASDRIGSQRPASEIARQIALTREETAAPGHVHWNMKSLMRDQGGIVGLLRGAYRETALVPASPWLGSDAPAPPRVEREGEGIAWRSMGKVPARWWAVQRKTSAEWRTQVLPATAESASREGAQAIAVRAVDRFGNASAATVVEY